MTARILTRADADLVRRLVAEDPASNVFIGSRVQAGVLDVSVPGQLWGWPAAAPTALLHVGANLVPMATNLDCLTDFVEVAGKRRTCQSVVGPSWLVRPYWDALCERWGRPYRAVREIRHSQPLLATVDPPRVAADPRVRPVTPDDFESYLKASASMYTEEVGVDPLAEGASGYRAYCRSLIEQGRAFGIVEDHRVIYKSDIGAACGNAAQIQGVWVDPAWRGSGMCAGAMAAMTEYVLADYPIACLYVNDFNTPAIRCYQKVGYQQVGEFTTILY